MCQEEEIYLRTDVNHLAETAQQANFNVRHFKKTHHIKPLIVSCQNSQENRVLQISTEPTEMREDSYYEELPTNYIRNSNKNRSKTLMSQTFNSALKKQNNFIEPDKKQHPNRKLKSQEKFNQCNFIDKKAHRKNIEVKTANQKKTYSVTEKQYNKGALQKRHIENWLNNILIEYCHEEYFDKNISLSALKKFQLDENSLISKGVKSKDIQRLYKSLFVYGIGFNNFLKQITNSNKQLMTCIWKIYAMMLEYCSDGNYQTLVGVMERNNLRKVAELSTEIEKKQEIIEKNEELNEKKNNQIFKEIKFLREENSNLSNEKAVLYEEYNLTDQAFSEEVTLRLKFETKINQIYGVHRQLGMKHHKLYEDFSKKIEQLRRTSEKYFEAVKKSQEYKQNWIDTKQMYEILKGTTEHDGEHIRELIKQKLQLNTKLAESNRQLAYYQSLASERELKVNQYRIEKENILVMMELRQKSAKETHKEYQITLEENNRLYFTISDQRKVMEVYQSEKKDFNSKIIRILSESSFNKKKFQETQRKLDELTKKHNEAIEKVNLFELNKQIFQKQIDNCKFDLTENYKNIQKMHKKNVQLEQQLEYLRKLQKNVNDLINERNVKIQKLNQTNDSQSLIIQQLKMENQNLSSKLQLVEYHLSIERQNNQKVIEKLQIQKNKFESLDNEKQNLIKVLQIQVQKYKGFLNDALTSYKNEKFQRHTLNQSYLQSLRIVQNKNSEIKELDCLISTMKEEINQGKNKYLSIEMKMFKLISSFGLIQEKLERTMQNQKNILDIKMQYVHPMELQNALHLFQRENTHKFILIQQYADLKDKSQNLIADLTLQIKRNHQKYALDIAKSNNSFQTKLNNKNSELEYEREIIVDLKNKLNKLEELSETYKKKIAERTTSERQEIYKYMLEEKKRQIDDLHAEIQKLQDQLVKIKYQAENIAREKDQQIQDQIAEIKYDIEVKIKKQMEVKLEERLKEIKREFYSEQAKKEKQRENALHEIIKSMTIDQILAIKQYEVDHAILELAQKSNKFKSISTKYRVQRGGFSKNVLKNEILQSSELTKQRLAMSKKIKHAYDYYN